MVNFLVAPGISRGVALVWMCRLVWRRQYLRRLCGADIFASPLRRRYFCVALFDAGIFCVALFDAGIFCVALFDATAHAPVVLAQRGGSTSLGPSRFLLSAVDEYCDLGMGQYFGGFASEQQRRQSFSAVRGHENEVAVFCLRRFYDSFPGMIIG